MRSPSSEHLLGTSASPSRRLVRAGGAFLATALLGAVQVPPHPLGDAIGRGDLATVRSLLQNRTSPNDTLPGGVSPLHLAAAGGHVEIAKLLIDAGARIEARTGEDGCTPLHVAAGAARTELVSLLLFARAQAGATTASGGLTPLHLAAQAKNGETIVRELLRRGVAPDVMDGARRTPLVLASAAGRAPAVRVLLAAGADSTRIAAADAAAPDPVPCAPPPPSR